MLSHSPWSAVYLRTTAILLIASFSLDPARSQEADPALAEALPEVEIIATSPSPVKKKPRKRRSSSVAQPSSTPTPPVFDAGASDTDLDPVEFDAGPVEATAPPRGWLNVVEDAFVPVTVVNEDEIFASHGANIADSLDEKPGISGTTYAPGANRPVIRGLDTYRVRVQENGIGSHDVSALSEDHVVPIDPFTAKRIEVIRGPATLRYGGQAFGGVVAVENDRIPSVIPPGGISGEIKGDLSSVDEGKNGAARITAGGGGFAVHADGFIRRSEDYDTPRGTQFNTFAESEGGAVGASLIGPNGFIGVSLQRYQFLYGLPGEEARELRPRLDGDQDRIQAKGEWNINGPAIKAARFWFGASDYLHEEIVNEGEGDEVGSRFSNEEVEGRVEVEHATISTSFGRLSGAFGVHAFTRDIEAKSFEGDSLLAPAETESIAGFLFEELQATSQLTLQAALRIEHTKVSGRNRAEPLHADDELMAFDRSFTPISFSLGGIYDLPDGTAFSINGQYVERAPDAAELYSAGIHEATGTFEIGDPTLDIEKARSIELGVRKARGPFRYDATAFYTRYDGFIFKSLTGRECEGGTLAGCEEHGHDDDDDHDEDEHHDDDDHDEDEHAEEEDGHGHEALDQVLFRQRDAYFVGVEIGAQYDVGRVFNGVWGIDARYDFVHARFTNGGNVPRIPPHRLGGGLFFRSNNLFARVGLLHAFDQDRFGENEIATPGYTLLSAELAYTDVVETGAGATQFTIGVKGENLADDEVLNHVSFKRREDVLLPGASVRVFGSIKLN